MTYWRFIVGRKYRTGQDDSVQAVIDQCTEGEGIGSSEAHLKGYARCAADIYCAQYSVPPGVCSEIAGFFTDKIIGAIADVLDNSGTGILPPAWFAVYQIRTLHDRLFPNETKWNSIEAWSTTAGTCITGDIETQSGGKVLGILPGQTPDKQTSSFCLPTPMYELIKRNGWDMKNPHTVTLLAAQQTFMNVGFPAWYAQEQQAFANAASKAQATLIARKSEREAKARSSGGGGIAFAILAALGLGALAFRRRRA